MNGEATSNGIVQRYSKNRAEISLVTEEFQTIGRGLKDIGDTLASRVGDAYVTAKDLRAHRYSREGLSSEILTDNYIRNGLVRLHELIKEHGELRQKMIDAGLGNLTEDLSSYSPTVSEELYD